MQMLNLMNILIQHYAATSAYAMQQGDGISSVSWSQVREAAIFDEECSTLCEWIAKGFPNKKAELPLKLHYYWPMRDDLYVIEGVPFKGRKMLIPESLRGRVLEGLHVAHQSVSGMQSNAAERFFWPSLNAAIQQIRSRCKQCNENAPSQPA